MKNRVLRKLMMFLTLISSVWLLSGCLYILQLIQVATADVNSQITTTIEVEMDESACACPGGGPSGAIVAVQVPTDWTIDGMDYDGDYGPQDLAYLHPDSLDGRPGAGVDHWYDSLDFRYPPAAGMQWVVYQGPNEGWIGSDTNNVTVTINMTTGAAGMYNIGYLISINDYNLTNPDEFDVRLENPINVGNVGIEETQLPGLAEQFELEQNFPNPFNPSTTIRYAIQQRTDVKLAVYDLSGREVTVLYQGAKAPGNYEIQFDASELASGVYLYRLVAGNFVQTRKMMLVR